MRTHPSTRVIGRRRLAALAAGLALSLLTAACSDNPKWRKPGETGPQDKTPPVEVAVTAPAEGATDVPTSAEIAYTVNNADSSTVELTDAAGAKVDGALRADKSSWVPAAQLRWSTQYTAKITGTNSTGKSESKTLTFTTMAKPANTARASTVIADNQVVGVGMPIIVSFSSDVGKDQRAGVQKRMFVVSDPPQEGIWHWFSAKEVHYRPKEYWQANTKISVRVAVGGVQIAGSRWGLQDLSIRATVGPKFMMVADNATKMMTVTRDGEVLRQIPVSFGKPSSPSASGNMIIMIKNEWEWFDSSSFGVPSDSPDGYRTKVYWPQRLTWDGEYIHAAPWSEKDQGKRNVSHGCTNISMAHAQWLWQQTRIGDPVIIKGTEQRLKWGNGWSDWDRPWEEYVKGSAIPYTPPALDPSAAPSGSASPAPSAS